MYHDKADPATVVLWFGGDEYEGIGEGYTFVGRTLRDGDGETVKSRLCRRSKVDVKFREHLPTLKAKMSGSARDPLDVYDGDSE